MTCIQKLLVIALFAIVPLSAFCQKIDPVIIDVDHFKAKIQPTMWGVFFEDINYAADGGLYAELVKNRSFEFEDPRMGWSIERGSADSTHFTVLNRYQSKPQNPHFARVKISEPNRTLTITNAGFRGMGVKKDITYYFSVFAAIPEGDVKMKISLISSKNEVIGSTTVTPIGKEWKKYENSFVSSATDARAKLRITFEGKGLIDIDMVSLFPSDTWKNRKNGLRGDLAQLLYDLKPGFIRFPGGCVVEGRKLSMRYQWKKSVGNVEDRALIMNKWNDGFAHRLTPDYYQSYGLGFFEYFQFAEDLGAEPLPILSCGMACQFNTAEVVPLDELDPYVQDALDLIEFANGPVTSQWGKLRADMGHPAPFNMKFIGVGNEQWGPQYFERYLVFEKAIKAKYPDIHIVSGTGPSPDGGLFDYAKEELKKHKASLVDEHYYASPEWFLKNATRYDSYDRNTYKIFAGEYAAQSVATCSPDNKNNWKCAMSEAAFMTGLERNADVVNMCSYAPLFAHVEGWQWTPDLIWFDNLKSIGSANYYVQKLFSNNKGTDLLSISQNAKPLVGDNGLYASAVWDANTNEVVLKLVNSNEQQLTQNFNLKSSKKVYAGKQIILKGNAPDAVNSFEEPTKISPVEQVLTVKGNKVNITLPEKSLSVIRLKLK
ncbi:MAG TPA: alpha-L-arabinofuranosidase C-terminal domain-containing protein [Bacteroidales bacterium]|nr:alpha-L-arabinofuranosidase C-terminal domain-containing protein [Bacteroidales bacterium]